MSTVELAMKRQINKNNYRTKTLLGQASCNSFHTCTCSSSFKYIISVTDLSLSHLAHLPSCLASQVLPLMFLILKHYR